MRQAKEVKKAPKKKEATRGRQGDRLSFHQVTQARDPPKTILQVQMERRTRAFSAARTTELLIFYA
jgi:hypothetical protein